QDAVGRARLEWYLGCRNPDSPAAPRKVQGQRVLYGRRSRPTGQGTIGQALWIWRQAGGERDRARPRWRVRLEGLPGAPALRPPNLINRRSTRWSAPCFHTRGAGEAAGASRLAARTDSIHRVVQEQMARVRRRNLQPGAVRPTIRRVQVLSGWRHQSS